LLGRFIDVCNAVAYAHSRGVLHRDLKPGNIMLGKFGETLVVDWGLAKVVGRGLSATQASDAADEGTLQPSSGSGVAETLAGSAIGTPSYMSPEQAAGRVADLGPATDVYSVGATFYTLLTNRSPVEAADTVEILHKVQRGEVGFADPAQPANPGRIPAPLVAICRKAMMPNPQDRYVSPLALAEDIEHWLADEPVRAYAEPWTVRAGRWVRRHRTAVTGAVAAVSVAMVCLAVATVLLSAARDSELQAKLLAEQNEKRAQEQRDKARARFVLARDAVDRYHTQVSDSHELQAAGLEKLRTRLLETAAAFYEKFVQEDEADASVDAERGHAYRRLGKIYQATGRHADADKAFLQCLAIRQRLADDHPGEVEFQAQLAGAHYFLGWLYQNIGRNDEAERHLLRSLSLWEPVLATRPGDLDFRGYQAHAYHDLGALYLKLGKRDLARDALEKAVAIRSQLSLEAPDNDTVRSGLMRGHTALGSLHVDGGRLAQAAKSYAQALQIAQQLVDKYPDSPLYLSDLALAHYNQGYACRGLGQRTKAERAFQEALKLQERLVGEHPTVVDHQFHLGNTQNMLGMVNADMQRLAAADTFYKDATATREKLFHAYPHVPEYAIELGGSYCNRGSLLRHLGNYGAATDLLLKARQTLEAVLSKDNRQDQAQRYLLEVYMSLGSAYGLQGRKQEGEEACQRAVEALEQRVRDFPGPTRDVLLLGGAWCNYGNRLFENDKPQPAVDAYTRAIDTLEGLLKTDPKYAQAHEFLANSLFARGRTLSKSLKRHADALADADRLVAMADDSKRDAARAVRAIFVARSGKHREAALEALDVGGKDSVIPLTLVNSAFAHAIAATVVRTDEQLAAAERDRLAEEYAAQAVALLSRAAAKDYYKAPAARAQLKTDPELAVLQARPDFKKLLADLEKPKKSAD
jgi:tetratricopeptide (TPR) repeat protein